MKVVLEMHVWNFWKYAYMCTIYQQYIVYVTFKYTHNYIIQNMKHQFLSRVKAKAYKKHFIC